MNDTSKKTFIEKLPALQFGEESKPCWQALTQGVTESAKALYEQSDKQQTPYNAWWQSCFDLLGPRQIVIGQVDCNGSSGNGEEDEFIEINNTGPMIVDLSNWRVNAGNEGQDVTIPVGTYILPGALIRIYTRKKGEFSFNSLHSVWNNKGDKAFLYDSKETLISSWLYGSKAWDEVSISHINFDGKEKGSEGDEYAQITNDSNCWVDVSGWQLSAGKAQNFQFPELSALAPKTSVRVYTNKIDAHSGGFSFKSKRAIWNNKGDIGTLRDNTGKQVSKLSYGDAV